MTRAKNRIIGGVCSSIGKKYNFKPWMVRIIFIVSSWFFFIPVLAYLIIWIIIPNEKKVEQKKLFKSQLYGIIIGGILGAIVLGGFTYLVAIIQNDPANGGIAPLLLAIFGLPVGMIIDFSIARAITEKKSFDTEK